MTQEEIDTARALIRYAGDAEAVADVDDELVEVERRGGRVLVEVGSEQRWWVDMRERVVERECWHPAQRALVNADARLMIDVDASSLDTLSLKALKTTLAGLLTDGNQAELDRRAHRAIAILKGVPLP